MGGLFGEERTRPDQSGGTAGVNLGSGSVSRCPLRVLIRANPDLKFATVLLEVFECP